MKMWLVQAKPRRTVRLPDATGTIVQVSDKHESLFPESPQLVLNRDRPDHMNDLASCRPEPTLDNAPVAAEPAAEPKPAKAPKGTAG